MNPQHQDEKKPHSRQKRPTREMDRKSEWLWATMYSIGDAVIATNTENRVSFMNPVAELLTGWTADEGVGRPLETIFQVVNDSTGEVIENLAKKVLREGKVVGLASHSLLIAKDGTQKPIDDSAAPIHGEDGQIAGVVLVFRDVTLQRQAERRRNARLAVTQILATETSIDKAIPDVLSAICSALRWDVASYWRFVPEQNRLQCQECWMQPAHDLDAFCEVTRKMSVGPGESLPGRAWKRQQPIWIPDVASDLEFHRAAHAQKDGLHGGFACLIGTGQAFLGVLECFSREIQEPDEDLLEMMATISGQIGQFLERRRAENALRESEARFRNLADAAPVLIWMSDAKKEYIYFNQTWLNFTGQPLEAQQGDAWLELVHPDDRDALFAISGEGFRNRVPFTAEFRLKRADGEYRWLLDTGTPRFGPDGRFEGFIGSCIDITERKQAEETQALLAAVVKSSDDAIITKTVEGTITSWNAGAERIFGYTAEEAVGRPITLIIPPELHDEECEFLERMERGEQITSFETVRVAKDGRPVNISVTVSPIHDSSGRIVGASKVARDITGMLATQAALHESERRLATLVSNLPGMAYRCEGDRDRTMKFVSDGSVELTGYSPEDFAEGRIHWRQIIHPEDDQLVWDAVRSGVRERRPYQIEYRIYQRGGTLRWVWEQGEGIFQDADEPVALEGFMTDITERKLAETALRAKEAELELITGTTPLIFTRCSRDLRYRFVNRAAASVVGLTPDEMIGRPLVDVLGEKNLIAIKPYIDRVLAGESLEFEIELPLRESGRRWFRVNYMPERNAAGELDGWIASIVDITDRKQAEEALRRSQERLALALEASGAAAWSWLIRKNQLDEWSPQFQQLYGLSPDGPITLQEWQERIYPEDRQRLLARLNQIQNTPGDDVWNEEFRIDHPEKGVRWIAGLGQCTRDESGRVRRITGVNFDITERKRMEQSLKFLAEASRSLASLIDYKSTLQNVARLAVPDFADWCAVDMLDNVGGIQRVAVAHVDPAKIRLAEELFARYPPDPEAPEGSMKVLRTGESDLAPSISDDMLANSARNEEHLSMLRELSPKSYMCVPLKSKETPFGIMIFVSAESGRQYGLDDLALAEELAHRAAVAIENARLYQEVQDADRRKDEFLAMLAHELRNPLAPIRSGLDLLAMDAETDHEMIGIMQEQVTHVVRLVDDLLDVSRIMRGKIELRKQPVQLSALIKQSVEAIRPLVEGHQQELMIALPNEPIWLDADPVRLLQVFENLLTNASKYTEPGGCIDLAVEVQKHQAVIAIRDTGVGIEPELLPTVFDLFTQSTRSLDRAKGGLGIGLTLVQRLVELHEGKVTAHSEGPGQGSTFIVQLPLADLPPQAAEEIEPAETTEGRRIVVVDDHVDAAFLLAKLLEKMGSHEVFITHEGHSALAKIQEIHPDLVLLDIGLPGMNGYEVAATIRDMPQFDDVLLVALTGYGQKEDREKSKAAGFDEHQVKPPSLEAMKAILAHPKLAHPQLSSPTQNHHKTKPPANNKKRSSRLSKASPGEEHPLETHNATGLQGVDLRQLKHDLGNVAYVLSLIGEMFMNGNNDEEVVSRAREAIEQEAVTINEMVKKLQNALD